MKTLRQYISEQKNVHIEHVEDLVFNQGVEGTRTAINFLIDLRNMLAGGSNQPIQASIKWDGAPAIFAGVDPRDGNFFVAKKGIFNKTPKVYKTAKEIESDTGGDLANKLKIALSELSKLNIRSGVYQGDFLFSSDDLKVEVIDGQRYTTFHPNTLVYAVPYDSPLANDIRRAKIGIVWHTMYTGGSFETMRAVYGKPIRTVLSAMGTNPAVWMDDAVYHDYSGTATFTEQETVSVNSILSDIGRLFRTIDAQTLNSFPANPDIVAEIKEYNNSKVRAGQQISNPVQHVSGLYQWITNKYQVQAQQKKTPRGQATVTAKQKKVLDWLADHSQQQLVKIFELSKMIADAKLVIISKMNQASHIPTFVKTPNGFRVADVEGFVAVDRRGNVVKLVDRMEFSRNNFDPTIIKGWQR